MSTPQINYTQGGGDGNEEDSWGPRRTAKAREVCQAIRRCPHIRCLASSVEGALQITRLGNSTSHWSNEANSRLCRSTAEKYLLILCVAHSRFRLPTQTTIS